MSILKTIKTSPTNSLQIQFEYVENLGQAKHKSSRQCILIKIRTEINKRKTKKSNKSKSWFFEMIYKVEKLAEQTKF